MIQPTTYDKCLALCKHLVTPTPPGTQNMARHIMSAQTTQTRTTTPLAANQRGQHPHFALVNFKWGPEELKEQQRRRGEGAYNNPKDRQQATSTTPRTNNQQSTTPRTNHQQSKGYIHKTRPGKGMRDGRCSQQTAASCPCHVLMR